MLRFSRVGLRYPDPARGPDRTRGADALRDLSFTLPSGSFTWLTGPSGAGKTSLLRLMQLALRPSEGEVEVLGVPVARAPRSALPALRRRIGAVFQEFRLLPYLTAFDNVALPLRLAGRAEASLRPDVAEILRWVGLGGREDALPPQLSGGEQQRAALARAVVTRPSLLVADEPTGNLDPEGARRVLALLAEMNRLGTTVVVATHARDLIAWHPGGLIALDAGRIVAHRPPPMPAGAEYGAGPGDPAGGDAGDEGPESGHTTASGAPAGEERREEGPDAGDPGAPPADAPPAAPGRFAPWRPTGDAPRRAASRPRDIWTAHDPGGAGR